MHGVNVPIPEIIWVKMAALLFMLAPIFGEFTNVCVCVWPHWLMQLSGFSSDCVHSFLSNHDVLLGLGGGASRGNAYRIIFRQGARKCINY